MATVYRSARSELRSVEFEWRAEPRSTFDLDEQLDRMPKWAAATVIFAIGLVLWSLVFGFGSLLNGLSP